MAVEGVSNEFKNMCKSNTPSGAIARIKILPDNITIAENTDIQDIGIEDMCYVNDKFIGTTVAKKVNVNIFNDDNVYDLENKEIEVKMGFDINNTEELVSYGNYIVEKPNTEEVQAKTQFVGYDYMIKFNKPFVDNNIYPVALGTYFSNLCTQVGLVAGNTNFVNSDYMVLGNPFTNGELCKDVLKAIAQIAGGIAKIGRDNKPYIISFGTGVETEKIDGNNYDSFMSNKVFGPINKLIIKMQDDVEGEESVRSDEDSIAQNGECAITISGNPILNNAEQREMVIDNIFNNIKGITYLPFKTSYYGYPHLDSTDKVKILNVDDTEYDSYMFNHTIKYDGAFSGNIETPALTKTQSVYRDTRNLKNWRRNTELQIDKINGQIKSLVEEITDLTNTATGIKTITISDAYPNEGTLELHIYGNNEVFDYLYPADDLYPDDTLYPYGDSRIRFYNSEEDRTIELGIDEVLRDNGAVRDEVFINKNEVYLIRRVNADGTTKTNEEKTLLGTLDFILREGDNTFQILNYSAPIEIKYAVQNDLTDLFATKMEMRTSITQTSSEIMTEVNKKVGEEELGTQIVQNYDSVKIAWNQISDYIKMMIYNSNTSLCILNENNQVIASFDKNGEHFYEAGQTIPFGEMGVQKEGTNKYIAFSVDGEYSESISNGMAWGIKTKSDGVFYPIFYIKNFEMGAPNTDGGYGQLVLAACDIVLDGLGTGIVSGDIKMYGDPIGHALYFVDINGRNLLTISEGLGSTDARVEILDKIFFYKNQGGTNSFKIGSDTSYVLMDDNGYFSVQNGTAIFGLDNSRVNFTIYPQTWATIYGDLNVNGNVYANNISSDERLKKNIKDSETNALDIIKQIKHRQFEMKENDKHFNIGYIAQELEKIDENFVIKRPKTETEEDRYYINELPIIATLSKAIQEQQEQIEKLQEEIRKLKEGK